MSKPVGNSQHAQGDNEEDEQGDTAYELVITNGKGYGLFATRSLPRGTRIIEESALITSEPSSSAHGLPGIDIEDLTEQLTNLSPGQHELYFDLYHDARFAATARRQIRRIQEHHKHAANDPPLPTAHELSLMEKLCAIYQTNFVNLGEEGNSGTGVFPTTSRINHSCAPNVQIYFISETKKLITHAVRHINKGEELSANYSPNTVYQTRRQRNATLRPWGFQCNCRACTGTGEKFATSESQRARIFEIELILAVLNEPSNISSAHQALGLAEELLEMLKVENITDRGLQSGYRRCSRYSLEAGLFDKAVAYAKKERDVERYCIGADTASLPHLQVDRKGAVSWLNYVLSERQAELDKRKAAEQWLKKEIARESEPKTKKSGKNKKK